MDKYVEIETKRFLNELTTIALIKDKLDENKIPKNYNDFLNPKEPKLKKLVSFFLNNPDVSELILKYFNYLKETNYQDINNRDKINELIRIDFIELMNKSNNKNHQIYKFVKKHESSFKSTKEAFRFFVEHSEKINPKTDKFKDRVETLHGSYKTNNGRNVRAKKKKTILKSRQVSTR